MASKTQKEQIQELCQAVIGIPENPDENGLIGDIRDILELLKEQNGRIRKNSKHIYILTGILMVVTGGTGYGVAQVLGG